MAKKTYHTGQDGPSIEIGIVDLNTRETMILDYLRESGGADKPTRLDSIQEGAFPTASKKDGYYYVISSLRRLVRAGFIGKIERGVYTLTTKGMDPPVDGADSYGRRRRVRL